MNEGFMTVEDARQVLGISRQKMSAMIKEGTFHTFPNPLDQRSKVIQRSEVLRMMTIGVTAHHRRFELCIAYTREGDIARMNLTSAQRLEQVYNNTERYVASELYRFAVGNFTELFAPGDMVQHVTLFTRELTEPGVNSGMVVPTVGGDDDLGLPPNFDPSANSQAFLVHVEYAPDGTPLHARWAIR